MDRRGGGCRALSRQRLTRRGFGQVHTHGHGGLQLADGIIDQRALLLKPDKLLLRFFERQPELPRVAPNRVVEVHRLLDLAQR